MTKKNVTILFTDLVDSTIILTSVAPLEADALRRHHFSVLREAIASTGGAEVKNLGDGLMVMFESASAALDCAVEMQRGVEASNAAHDRPMGVRVGISGGEVTLEDGDYFGDPVIEAARLCSLCSAGKVLAADIVRLTAGRRNTYECVPMGDLTLKGLPYKVVAVEVLWQLPDASAATDAPAEPPAVPAPDPFIDPPGRAARDDAGDPAGDQRTPEVVVAVAALCDSAVEGAAGTPLAARATSIRDRFTGPLRVAIAGRVKAGKSTLLNALVGERLAATDAGECTRVVTVFQHAEGYRVEAVLHDGTRRPLQFRRTEGALHVELGDLAPDRIATLEVGWPSSVLRRVTLIDTPGLASLDGPTSRRTLDFFDHSQEQVSGADAVVYLMRHLHRADADFLAAFMDRSVAGASPVNAVAVLSRADEIGAGRLDAMDSAATIAARYRSDAGVGALVSAVVPVAGLLAQTASSLRENEAAALRSLAALPAHERDTMLLSSDDFCDVGLSGLTAEVRRDLLDRLGMYGVRSAVHDLLANPTITTSELARALAGRSGIAALQTLIATQFGPRARLLQARSALVSLRGLATDLAAHAPQAAHTLRDDIDRLEVTALDFARLTAVHLTMSGAAKLPPAESSEVGGLLANASLADVLLQGAHDTDARQQLALAGIERWRIRADDPLANTAVAVVADTMARLYEHLYVTA